MSTAQYALVTPARNEEDLIELTLSSVAAQTAPPERWVVVSDGSTDRTDEIVQGYAARFPFIRLLRLERSEERTFASKAHAVDAGVRELTGVEYDFLGNLDADIELPPDYFEKILAKLQNHPEIGIAGGVLYDRWGDRFVKKIHSLDSVAGPVQLFRRQCYEEVGGYLALRKGGVDAMAEVMARMNGWKVQSFPDIEAKHHRTTGTALDSILSARFRQGVQDHSHGCHPLFEVARCGFRLIERPYVLGSLWRVGGFVSACLSGEKREVPPEVAAFLRREQLTRLGLGFLASKREKTDE